MTETKSPIVFYCKDCEKLVDASKFGKRYVYTCKICGTKNVAFGTEKSIKNFFRIPEEKKEETPVPAPTAAKAAGKEVPVPVPTAVKPVAAKAAEKDAPVPAKVESAPSAPNKK